MKKEKALKINFALLDDIKVKLPRSSWLKRSRKIIYRHTFGFATKVIDLAKNPLSSFAEEVMDNIKGIHPSLYHKGNDELRKMKADNFAELLNERKDLEESYRTGVTALNTARFDVFKGRVVEYLFCSALVQLNFSRKG